MSMRICAGVCTALFLTAGSAFAMPGTQTNPGAVAPASAVSVATPAPAPLAHPPAFAEVRAAAAALAPVQVEPTRTAAQAGMAKPVKLYWFLSGR